MQIKISNDNLTVLKSSFSCVEEGLFSDAAAELPESLVVFEHHYTWVISGSSANLYAALVSLSNKFDIEIV